MNKRILTPIAILALAALACLGPSAVTKREADSAAGVVTPALMNAAPPPENPAGEVYDLQNCGRDQSTAQFCRPTPGPLCAVVTADEALHLRTQPNEGAEHIEYLTRGQQLNILAYGPWWKVQTSAGQIGYANSRYMEARLCQP